MPKCTKVNNLFNSRGIYPHSYNWFYIDKHNYQQTPALSLAWPGENYIKLMPPSIHVSASIVYSQTWGHRLVMIRNRNSNFKDEKHDLLVTIALNMKWYDLQRQMICAFLHWKATELTSKLTKHPQTQAYKCRDRAYRKRDFGWMVARTINNSSNKCIPGTRCINKFWWRNLLSRSKK